MQTRWLDPPAAPGVLLGAMGCAVSQAMAFTVPAHALATLTIVTQGRLWHEEVTGSERPLPGIFCGGAFNACARFRAEADTRWLAVFGRADLWARLGRCSAQGFRDQFFDPRRLASGATSLMQALGAVDDLPAGKDEGLEALAWLGVRLQEALRDDLAACPPHPEAAHLEAALALLADESLPVVLQRLELSERRLQRLFRHQLGITPKRIERLARLHRAVRCWDQGRGAAGSLADLSQALGYADQAHLARDFRLLVGAPPLHLRSDASGALLWALREGGRQLAPALFKGATVSA